MGTRNLIAVYLNGEYCIAQYCQWDGYPEGQGKDVLAFCRKLQGKEVYDRFVRQLKTTVWIEEEKLNQLWKEAGADERGMIEYNLAKEFSKRYPQFSRDTGAGILDWVYYGNHNLEQLELSNGITFAGDGLFCEWAYVLDLDKNQLEVYKGFHQGDINSEERFANFERGPNSKYTPVKLRQAWSLEALPSEEDFIETFRKEDVEQESAEETD
jgi:hypothetical protein